MNNEWLTRQTLLVRAQKQDDALAWEEFVNYYESFIAVVLRKMGMKAEHREDMAQEILLKIWKGLPNFEIDSSRARFRTWLSTVIRNTAITYFNQQKNHDFKNSDIDLSDEKYEHLLARDDDMDKIVQKEWEKHICNLAMAKIKPLFSPRAMEVFDMFLHEKSIEEISAAVGIKENSVYKLKNRVRARLKEEVHNLCRELEPCGGVPYDSSSALG